MSLRSICILVLSLPLCTCQSCTEGKPQECIDAEIVPGANLAGEGFDITKLERKGAFVLDMNQWRRKDKKCTLCSNPYQENRKQKLPLSVEDWRTKHFCSMKVASAVHRSSESLVSASTSSIENSWNMNLDINMPDKSGSLQLAGTHSKMADYSMGKTKNDKYSFTSQSISCEFYSYRVSSTPKLHREFRKAVKQLPKTYSSKYKMRFYKLIDTFGTHFITKVKLGGSVQSVTSIKQCEVSLSGLTVEEVGMCLEVEASASIKAVEIGTKVSHCRKDIQKTESKSRFSSLFNDRFTEIKGGHTTEPDLLYSAETNPSAYKDWLTTLPNNPDIISYSLESLHELLPLNSPERKNLRSAISHYILERGVWRNCSESCQAGIKTNTRDPCTCQCHNVPGVNQDCCPIRKGTARVIITVQRAAGLWGDHSTATDGYAKAIFQGTIYRTRVIYNNNNPHWAATFDLGTQYLTPDSTVRFEVWDEDNKWDDDLLGNCDWRLTAGVKQDLCNLQHGELFYKLEVTCAPSLGGESCMNYQRSPMNQSLKKLYVSRHAQPVPKDILLMMGVFVDETSSQRNHSQKYDGVI